MSVVVAVFIGWCSGLLTAVAILAVDERRTERRFLSLEEGADTVSYPLIEDHPLLGQDCRWQQDDNEFIDATITGVRRPVATMHKADGSVWGAIQFRLKPSTGARAFWTCSMPDGDRPLNDAARAASKGRTDGKDGSEGTDVST